MSSLLHQRGIGSTGSSQTRYVQSTQLKSIDEKLAHWFGFAAVAGAFGGLIAFGIQNANVAIAHWRLLFIIEVSLNLSCYTILTEVLLAY